MGQHALCKSWVTLIKWEFAKTQWVNFFPPYVWILHFMYEVVRTSSKCHWSIYRTSSKCRWSVYRTKRKRGESRRVVHEGERSSPTVFMFTQNEVPKYKHIKNWHKTCETQKTRLDYVCPALSVRNMLWIVEFQQRVLMHKKVGANQVCIIINCPCFFMRICLRIGLSPVMWVHKVLIFVIIIFVL